MGVNRNETSVRALFYDGYNRSCMLAGCNVCIKGVRV